ncbi:MAG: ABC transporter substrate-binding protein [Candidatus Methylomirabilales bacterium]
MAAAPSSASRRRLRRLVLGLAAAGVLAAGSPLHAGEKTLTYAISGAPESLDSAKASSDRSYYVTWLLCDALLNISKDGQGLEPGLAQSWTLSPDGLQAVLRLRPNARFHDGTPVDAGAVKASLERQFLPAHPLYTAEPRNSKEPLLRDLIAHVEVRGPDTVAFRLKYPGLHYLSQVDIVSPSALAKAGKAFGRSPVCSGPFKLERWSAEQLVLAANDQYWAGRPRIARVVFKFIPETKAVVDALVSGEADFSPFLVDTVFFERLREHPRTRLVPVSGLNIFYLGFYTERAPFNNALLRRAIASGINASRAALFLGRGAAVAAKGPLPPAVKDHDGGAGQAPHDPQAARALLEQAGQGHGLTLKLLHNSAVTFDAEVAGAIQNDLQRIGVSVELVGKPSSGDVFKAVRAREGDMFLYSWHVRAPYPERILVPLFHSRSPDTTNVTRYRNPALDTLLGEALQLPEGPARSRLYSQAQRLIVDDAPMVFLYHAVRMAAHTDRVRGLDLNLGSLPHDKLVNVDLAP